MREGGGKGRGGRGREGGRVPIELVHILHLLVNSDLGLIPLPLSHFSSTNLIHSWAQSRMPSPSSWYAMSSPSSLNTSRIY